MREYFSIKIKWSKFLNFGAKNDPKIRNFSFISLDALNTKTLSELFNMRVTCTKGQTSHRGQIGLPRRQRAVTSKAFPRYPTQFIRTNFAHRTQLGNLFKVNVTHICKKDPTKLQILRPKFGIPQLTNDCVPNYNEIAYERAK